MTTALPAEVHARDMPLSYTAAISIGGAHLGGIASAGSVTFVVRDKGNAVLFTVQAGATSKTMQTMLSFRVK
jgi:hypothetical protein